MTPLELQQVTKKEVANTKAQLKALAKRNIIARLGDGMSLFDITHLDGFPSYQTVIRWAEKDETFGNDLKTARVAGGYVAADKASKLVDDILGEPFMNEKLVNPVLTHLRWVAERQSRGTYGQHVEVKHSGTVSVRTSFLIPRTKQSVDDGEVIDLDSSLQPAQLGQGPVGEEDDDDWLG